MKKSTLILVACLAVAAGILVFLALRGSGTQEIVSPVLPESSAGNADRDIPSPDSGIFFVILTSRRLLMTTRHTLN